MGEPRAGQARPLLGAAFFALLAPVFAADRALDPAQFVAALDDVVSVVSSADGSRLADVASRLPTGWSVAVGTEEVNVSAGWIQEQVGLARADPSTWPAVRDRILLRLRGIRREARALAGATPATPSDRGRGALGEVLNRQEFVDRRSSTWIEDLRARITDWIVGLWRQLGGQRLGRRGTAVLFAWIAGLGALAVLGYWLASTIVRSSPRTGLRLATPASRRLSARAWARRAASAGDPREVARCAYNAAVVRLDEEGAWKLDDARTPREYVRLLPAAHRRRPAVADVTTRFEQIRYGGRPATTVDRDVLLEHLKDLGCLPRA